MNNLITMNQRLKNAGINRVVVKTCNGDVIHLEKDGKQIKRPHYNDCVAVCRSVFGVEI